MGKSDPHVFNWYLQQLPKNVGNVAFLGFSGPNDFTRSISAQNAFYYDLTLGNWEINSPNWNIPKGAFDLVVCTRCAYFASNPNEFIKQAFSILKRGGMLFVDWGLGNHWNFPMFKVGHVRGGEHETIQYGNFSSRLYSTFWDDRLENDSNVVQFRNLISRFGYDYSLTLGDIIRQEVPAILKPTNIGPAQIRTLLLWPESPQLYISTTFIKDPI